MTAVVALQDVTQRYPTGAGMVEALAGVDLTVGRGELVGVVGPSGSGKSTLLDVVGALRRPTAGQVMIAGQDTSRLADGGLAALRAYDIGFVFQQFHLLEGVTAVDNVAAALLYRALRPGRRRELAMEALARVGLRNRAHHRPDQLSGGERQRVAIARALVGDPAILLADEPTGNLDSATGERIVALFLALHRQGSTIMIITHDQNLAARLPRQVTMCDGRIIADDVATPAVAP